MNKIKWPDGKKFAFTIIDDTDNSFIGNTKPIYDLLNNYGIKTTKTVWVYPPRDKFTGQCLMDHEYREFVKDLQNKGYEIALHNVGSGAFERNEIIKGLEYFKEMIGTYPNMQINHASNPDNIYWGEERYTILARLFIKALYGAKRKYNGTNPNSNFFWGDLCKENIKYIRNHVFNGINTLKYDPNMPYRVKKKDKYSNFWFSSSDAHTIEEFNNLVNVESIEKLEKQGGACIIYTHFTDGFINGEGNIDPSFEANMRYLKDKDGWFVPASTIFDYMLENRKEDRRIRYISLLRLDIIWLIERILRKFKYGR